jgi:hypothetical protein
MIITRLAMSVHAEALDADPVLLTHQPETVGMTIRTPLRETLLARTDEFVSEIDSDQRHHDTVRIIFAVSSRGKQSHLNF